MKPQIIIFTDLDGTLLDHDTYSFEPALPALEVLKRQRIPLVVCTSKTAEEIQALRLKIGNTDPFISENGGGIFVPKGYFPFPFEHHRETPGYLIMDIGAAYETLTASLQRIRQATGLPLRGFSMMAAAEVARLCGFSLQEAELAMQREYDEPLIIDNATGTVRQQEQQLLDAVRKEGLFLTRGGRFYHLTGPSDKGRAVRMLLELFRRAHGAVYSIALGDSLNDEPMLREAEAAVVMQREDGSYESIHGCDCRTSDAPGPAGWGRAVIRLIEGQ